MKIILLSMIDNAFMPGFTAFYKSVVKNSPKILNYKWRFIDTGLSNSNKSYMASLLHDNVEFVKPRFENYKHINMSITDDCLKNTYYKLDIFSYTDCDRVVFIDMDTIALGDLNNSFMVKAITNWEVTLVPRPTTAVLQSSALDFL